jgi:hypothetical protein
VKPVGFPTWQDQVRGDAPTITVRTAIDNARTYREYVGTVFQDQFASRTRSVGESMRPDLFYSLLAFELLGHRAVYAARKELALLRLVQDGGDQAEMADALRLLRHAAAKNELDLALRRLRAGGPLSVLSRDARQVLRTRTAPELLRRVELQVLGAAAELLAPPEARVALDAIRATLAAGGPRDLPGWSELPVLRKEVAWVAAAALGNACGAASEVANLLLDEAEKHRQEDELVDRGLRRALAEVEWGDVQPDVREAWTTFLRTRGADLSGTAEVLSIQIGSQAFAPVPLSAMDSLARRLNAALGGEPLDPALGREGIPMVREALKKIRSEAAKGTYSISGISPADVAAGLILMAGAQELWPELTDFLLDSHVHREDRTPAFERLARADLSLPTDVIARFHARAQELLLATSSSRLFEPSLVPYPSALRFLGAHRLLDEADTYDAVATLSGAVSTAARYEAAVTVAVLAATSPRSHLLALVLPLSRDHDVDVRANAGRALAALAQPEEPLGAVAVRRLAELLAEDGLLAPLLVLRALADAPGGLPALVRRQVEELAAQHPSRSVRTEASRLLAPQHSGEENGP